MMRYIILLAMTMFILNGCATVPNGIQPTAVIKIKNIPEPSDIARSADGKIYLVSDKGYLYEVDDTFQVVKKFAFRGHDFEGVGVDAQTNTIYVADERPRKIYQFQPDQDQPIKSITVDSENGGGNKGFEGVFFDDENQQFLIVREKNPTAILIVTLTGKKVQEIEFPADDLSAITKYDQTVYVLSDEEATLYKLNDQFQTTQQWKLPVNNAEGVTFIDEETIWVVSDAESKIYIFNLKEEQQ